MKHNRLTPSAGTVEAVEARRICDQLNRAVAVIGRRGIADQAAVDAESVDFLLALMNWEIADQSSKPLRWAYCLGEHNTVCSAWRQVGGVRARGLTAVVAEAPAIAAGRRHPLHPFARPIRPALCTLL